MDEIHDSLLSDQIMMNEIFEVLCTDAWSNHHEWNTWTTDDTQLSKSAPPEEFIYLQSGIQRRIDGVLSWMNSNKLMLNTNKAEVMTVGAPSRLRLVDSDWANVEGSNGWWTLELAQAGLRTSSCFCLIWSARHTGFWMGVKQLVFVYCWLRAQSRTSCGVNKTTRDDGHLNWPRSAYFVGRLSSLVKTSHWLLKGHPANGTDLNTYVAIAIFDLTNWGSVNSHVGPIWIYM